MEEKSEVPEKFKLFLKDARTTGHPIQELLSDNGKEYVNSKVDQIVNEYGIRHRLVMPYILQQNSCCERENRTVVETTRAIMHAREGLP